jgi:hypothetical protein
VDPAVALDPKIEFDWDYHQHGKHTHTTRRGSELKDEFDLRNRVAKYDGLELVAAFRS